MSVPMRPNILLITTDQQRLDTLGCCGSTGARTPHIDALAGRGTVFASAYAQNPVCIPSRACLQTGRYTHQHGVTYMESVIDTTPGLPEWEKTFMERQGRVHAAVQVRLLGARGARAVLRPPGRPAGAPQPDR